MSSNLTWYLVVSAIIFTIGVTGVLIRRNPLIIFHVNRTYAKCR